MTERFDTGDQALCELLLRQDGVVSRRQLLAMGARRHDLERMLRRRELRRLCAGVYVNHTGPPTQRQREWAAVLAAWPAALTGPSALPGTTPGKVHVAIARGRTVCAQDGAVIHRTSHLRQRVLWHRAPPRMRVEHALVEVMSQRLGADDVAGAFSELTRVAYSRQTTAERILDTLTSRRRVPGRTLIRAMLEDWRDGVCSVLERGYRSEVERPHGLPRASRQHPSDATGARTHQDVRYQRYSLVVELDGLVFHADADSRDHDAARDLAELATSGAPTARVTYGLVFRTPCRTAGWIAEILRHRGWTGTLTSCPRCPPRA